MSSALSSRVDRASTEVEDVLTSRSRRRVSGQLGRKHFNLAPGLLSHATHDDNGSASTSSSPLSPSFGILNALPYDEAWARWMQHGPRTTTESYDEAWSRVFRAKERHSNATPTVAATLTKPSTPFEEAPREATRPIMSRLPLVTGEVDAIAAEPTKEGALDYLSVANGTTLGVHPDTSTASDVTYTRARLPVLDDESLHLWRALHTLRGISDDYAYGYEATPSSRAAKGKTATATAAPHPISDDMDIDQCPAFTAPTSTASDRALALVKRLFNWSELPSLPVEDEYTWYGVAFRSKRRVGSESENLYEADRRSHEEAVDSGGLLMYWYGRPNAQTGHNLATCVWTNRQDALRASALPLHARAAAHALKAYESFELNRYALRKVKGETKLRVEEWTEAL